MSMEKSIVSVGGVLSIEGDIEFGEITVGGTLDIKGSVKGGRITVGGRLKIDGDASVEKKIAVGGEVMVRGEVRTGEIEVGGALKAQACFANSVKVGGKVETVKGVKADVFELGKKGRALGPVVAEQVKIGGDASVEDVYAERLELNEGASARNIYAKEVYLHSDCRVTGEILYVDKIEIEHGVEMQSEPRKVERLPNTPI